MSSEGNAFTNKHLVVVNCIQPCINEECASNSGRSKDEADSSLEVNPRLGSHDHDPILTGALRYSSSLSSLRLWETNGAAFLICPRGAAWPALPPGVLGQALDATMICFIMRRLYW